MPNALERLRAGLQDRTMDLSLLADLEKEQGELVRRVNELEELLIMIVRTGCPGTTRGSPTPSSTPAGTASPRRWPRRANCSAWTGAA